MLVFNKKSNQKSPAQRGFFFSVIQLDIISTVVPMFFIGMKWKNLKLLLLPNSKRF